MWDDRSLLNIDFSIICSAYTVQEINLIEKQARTPRTPPAPCNPHRPPCPCPAPTLGYVLRYVSSRAAAACGSFSS